jgi:hypothetical protein
MSVVLCVALWPNPGMESELAAYEDAVLALLPEHGARLVARVRASAEEASSDDRPPETLPWETLPQETLPWETLPLETQIIELPDEVALESYLSDPRRTGRTAERDAVIAHTRIQRVVLTAEDAASPPDR